MSKIIFITGGERSGKSSFAMNMAGKLARKPVYLATARVWDKDFESRINHHKKERYENWINIEEEKHFSNHNLNGQVVVLDCITLWLTNLFHDSGFQYDPAMEEAKNEWDQLMKQDLTLIVVSNEIGMGVHASTESGRKFVELQGRMNQYIADLADEAYLMVSGIQVKIK